MTTLFRWTLDHKMTSIGRAHFDARHGRVPLALSRLAVMTQIFPQDPDLALAEAVVRLDYLGQGVKARELFEKTYHWGHNDAAGAKNAALAARSAEEFQEWGDIALPLAPQDRQFQEQVDMIRKLLGDGFPFWQVLLFRAGSAGKLQDFSTGAAIGELALLYAREMGSEKELMARRGRAKYLRELDKAAASRRQALMEPLQPTERPALEAAVAEMDEILRLDEYDPEMWNFKSAWCVILKRFDEADACAERALALRPHGYPKPLVNKASARLKQKQYNEALTLARQALKVAQGTQYLSDVNLAQGIIQQASHPPKPLYLEDLPRFAALFLQTAEGVSDEEIGSYGKNYPVYKLVNGVLLRLMDLKSSQEATAVMAELTADFSPETVSAILAGVRAQDPGLFEVALLGMLSAAVQTQGAFQRDAARGLALTMLRAGEAAAILAWYRRLVLAPSKADPSLLPLAWVVQEELKRINFALPGLIADQPSLTPAETRQFLQASGKFGKLPPFPKWLFPPRFPVKFVAGALLVLLLIIWALYYFLSRR